MKRILLVLLFLCRLSIVLVARTQYSINEGWEFRYGPDSVSSGRDKDGWRRIDLPHTWNAEDVDDEAGGYFRGKAFYRKKVMVVRPEGTARVYILFEGSNQETRLYVNGHLVGHHRGGYSAFSFDLTDVVNFDRENNLLIEVTNSHDRTIAPLSADFNFFGGVYRDVWLVYTSQIHLSMDDVGSSGISVRTPHDNGVFRGVSVLTKLDKHISRRKTVRIVHTLFDGNNVVVRTSVGRVKFDARQEQASDEAFIPVSGPRLWSVDDPFLYTVLTRIYDAQTDELLDEVPTRFGFRWFRFDPDKGFFLNGKHLKLIGTSRHQDFLKKGNALTDDIHLRDVMKLKEMGANFLRIAHYPHDPTVLDACDRLGIVASVEIPVVNAVDSSALFLENCQRMELEMMRQNRNHPSVIMWGIMNEVLLRIPKEVQDKKSYFDLVHQIAARLDTAARAEDPDRCTFLAIHNAKELYQQAGLMDLCMVLGLNLYQGWYEKDITEFEKTLDEIHAQYPSLPLMVTEYGVGVDPRLYSDQPERFDFSQEYGVSYHRHYFREISRRDFLAGSSIWNLNDFYSESRGDAVPHVNSKGLTGLDREEKDAYLYYKAVLAKRPVVLIGKRHWMFRAVMGDSVGGQIHVPVYTNAESVELYANGRKVATLSVENGQALFTIPVRNGENHLEARAWFDGVTVTDMVKFHEQVIPRDLKPFPIEGLHVSLGSHRYFEDRVDGVCWMPEQEYKVGSWGYVGGHVYRREGGQLGTDSDILGTGNDPIYQTQRVGIQSYKADVPDGQYVIDLHFAALKDAAPIVYNLNKDSETNRVHEACVFDVAINGRVVARDLDPAGTYGLVRSVSRRFIVDTYGGQGIDIQFIPKKGVTFLNAIRIFRK